MKLISYYEVQVWDGGDRHLPSAKRFTSRQEAQKQCTKYDRIVHHEYMIYDTEDEYILSSIELTRKHALAKLTDAEKKALGL